MNGVEESMRELREKCDSQVSRRAIILAMGVGLGAVAAVKVVPTKGPFAESAVSGPDARLRQPEASAAGWAGGSKTVYEYDSDHGTIYAYDAQGRLVCCWDCSPRRFVDQGPAEQDEQPSLPFDDSEELPCGQGVIG